MTRHLRRFGLLYCTLLVLAGWPAAILRMQSPPKMDKETLRRLARIIPEQFARHHPDNIMRPRDYVAPFELPGESDPLDRAIVFRVSSTLGGPGGMPAMRPDLDWIDQLINDKMKSWDALTLQGVIFFRGRTGDVKASTHTQPHEQQVPNFLAHQTLCKLRRVQAERAIAERRWDDALQLLESAARISDPLRYESMLGYLIAVATRAIGYGGYVSLLQAGPPPEVSRAALDALAALRASDPVFDEWVWLGEKNYKIAYVLNSSPKRPIASVGNQKIYSSYLEDAGMRRYEMLAAAAGLVKFKDRIRNPKLKAWAERFARQYPPDEVRGMVGFKPAQWKWTTTPAIAQWLRQMAIKEPWVYRCALIPEAEYQHLDPLTLLMLAPGPGLAMANFLEAATRGQVAKTKGRLVEAGFAARLFNEKTGAWPTDLNELAGMAPLPGDKPTTSVSSMGWNYIDFKTAPFLPLRIAERPLTEELKMTLWDQVLNFRNFYNHSNLLLQAGTLEYVEHSPNTEYIQEPVRLLAITEAFKSHPRLVESAEALMSNEQIDSQGPSQAPRAWLPLDPALARRVTDAYDRRAMKNQQILHTPATSSTETIDAVRLRARLCAPEKAMVIWSPGPDGVDDGGTVSYDPSNGTTSRGDLLVFPETY